MYYFRERNISQTSEPGYLDCNVMDDVKYAEVLSLSLSPLSILSAMNAALMLIRGFGVKRAL